MANPQKQLMGRIPAFPLGCDNIPQPIPIYFPQFRTRKPRFPNRGHRSANSALAKFAAAQRSAGTGGGAPRPAPLPGENGRTQPGRDPSHPLPGKLSRCPRQAQRAASPEQRAGCGRRCPRRCAGAAPAQRPPRGAVQK